MQLPSELSITEEDWNHTPLAVQAAILALWKQSQVLQGQVVELRKEVALLREQVGAIRRTRRSHPHLTDRVHPHVPNKRRRGERLVDKKGTLGMGARCCTPSKGRPRLSG